MNQMGLFTNASEPIVNWNDYVVSLQFNETRILRSIIHLHNEGRPFEVDPCYATGRIWQDLPPPRFRYDSHPQTPDTQQADARNLPLGDESVHSVLFDPPFLMKDMDNRTPTGVMETRFSGYRNATELYGFYKDALTEFKRILLPKGIVAFKCQDTVSGGKQYLSHVHVVNMAQELGYYVKDLFVLGRHNVMWSPNMVNQVHARKNHCYYLVLIKE